MQLRGNITKKVGAPRFRELRYCRLRFGSLFPSVQRHTSARDKTRHTNKHALLPVGGIGDVLMMDEVWYRYPSQGHVPLILQSRMRCEHTS